MQEAVEYYVDAVKYDPTIPETYYRLASLMWEQGQISVNSAIEQCKTAISLSPNNKDAHLYTGYFMQLAQDFQSAEKEFKSAIKMNPLSSGRPRMILSQSLLQKINSQNGTYKDYLGFVYYFLTGSVMLAWDRPTMKMISKNMADDVSVFHTTLLENSLSILKCMIQLKIVQKAVENTTHSEYFYNKIGDIALKIKILIQP